MFIPLVVAARKDEAQESARGGEAEESRRASEELKLPRLVSAKN